MPNIGDALKKAVEVKPRKEADATRIGPSSALMNPNRKNIYQHLLKYPCSGIGQIARSVEQSRSTVSWHLNYLVKSGYVDSHIYGKKRIFCPSGLISRKNMGVFSLLNGATALSVYRAIIEEPGQDPGKLRENIGASAGQISEILKKLLSSNIVSSIRDGRHVRYFPTGRYEQIIQDDISFRKEFIRKLVIKMNSEHLHPEVSELKGGGIIIQFKVPDHISKLEIPHHPLANLILAHS